MSPIWSDDLAEIARIYYISLSKFSGHTFTVFIMFCFLFYCEERFFWISFVNEKNVRFYWTCACVQNSGGDSGLGVGLGELLSLPALGSSLTSGSVPSTVDGAQQTFIIEDFEGWKLHGEAFHSPPTVKLHKRS